jgi:glycyl-tRNA synthetase beta chain
MPVPEELLLEVGSEEIPARSMGPVLAELAQKFEQLLNDSRLAFGSVSTLGSARRLVVHVTDLAERQDTETVTTLGPPENVAFKDGKASKALEGFAKKSGVEVEALEVFATERGRYVGFKSEVPGRNTGEILSEQIPELVRSLSFHKTMYWMPSGQRFARPVRWVLARHGSSLLPLELFGVQAGMESAGHRVIGSQSITVSGFEDYLEKLERNGVLVSQVARRTKIETELEAAARRLGGRIIVDESLLEEVVYINEYPTVIAGDFEARFLELPREILITVMKEHQKYFALENGEGELLPHFLAVINTRGDTRGLIKKGHERVLKARLSDALFFWDVDGKQTLEQRVPRLDTIVFHNALGTYGDKVNRMVKLAEAVNRLTDSGIDSDVLRSVVRWSKSDLTTDLVGEFPDLQGVVGGLYARREGVSEEIATAIYDQYRPGGLEDSSPRSPIGAVLALADRLDTLFGCFSVGLIPTGSEDPLGLRRHTQGVIKILLDHHVDFSMRDAMRADGRMDRESSDRLQVFYEDRVRHLLGVRDFAYDEINAVLATDADNPVNVLERIEALREIRKSRDFLALAAAFKRIKNILKQSPEEEGPPSAESDQGELEPEEAVLAERVREIGPQVEAWAASGNYTSALETMASLRPLVDQFFDKILVMHEDPAVRARRIHLLRRLFNTFLQIADVSEVVVSG